MKILAATLFLALVCTGQCQSPQPVTADDPSAAITQLREGLVTSFNAGDLDTLLSYLDPDVIVTWQNAEICRGPEAVRAFYDRMMKGDKSVVRSIQTKPEIIGRHVYGDWAVSWGNLNDEFKLNEGSDLPFHSVFTAAIARRGDRWLVTAFHASVNVFDNPVLALATQKTALYAGLGAGLAGIILGLVLARLLFRKKPAA